MINYNLVSFNLCQKVVLITKHLFLILNDIAKWQPIWKWMLSYIIQYYKKIKFYTVMLDQEQEAIVSLAILVLNSM